ncbi:MAG TPA: DUF5309 family protein [Candidatus Binatus sp.]|nr:DUF5309 family protein [Candidatus Binatus sp.]
MIYNIAPTETPFMTKAGRTTASAVFHEWQTDTIAAAVATNAAIEGDNPTNTSVVPTVRLGNYCQISTYAFQVSGTQQVVKSAGRSDDLAYQLVIYGKRLKRDMEAVLTQNKGSTAGGAGSARTSGSLESWLSSNNTTLGSGGSPSTSGFQSGLVQAPVDNSVQGTITEAAVKAIIRACWTAGGNPDTIMTGPFNKTKVSGFSGILTNNIFQKAGGQATIIAAADAYVSDYGNHNVVPNRFNRDRTVCVLDMEYWSIAYLRSFTQFPLAKTGDSDQRQILAEYCLVNKNQAASGKVADLTTS